MAKRDVRGRSGRAPRVARNCGPPRKLRAIFRNSGGDATLIGSVQASPTLDFGTLKFDGSSVARRCQNREYQTADHGSGRSAPNTRPRSGAIVAGSDCRRARAAGQGPSNCAPRPGLSGCGATRAGLTKPVICLHLSMAGSPKGSTHPTASRRRRCSLAWRELAITGARVRLSPCSG